MLQGHFLRIFGVSVWLAGLSAGSGYAPSLLAADPRPAARLAVMHLADGDFAAGRLVDSPAADGLLWHVPGFAGPFPFRVDAVRAIHFPVPDKLPQAAGAYRIELAGGDVLFGSLAALRGEAAELEVAELGRLHVDRSILRRMSRWNGGSDVVYFGPNGLEGWKVHDPARPWREDAGHLIADGKGAAIRRDLGIPAQARMEFELSWTSPPDFAVILGAGETPKDADGAYRLEVWDERLVALRETTREADLAPLQEIKTGAGRLHLQVFLDQERGRLLVYSSGGEQLADLSVAPEKTAVSGVLQLVSRGGDLRLERLSVGHWNGEVPGAVEADKTRLHRTDGGIRYGQIKAYDAARREFVVENDGTSETVAEDHVQDLFFSQSQDAAPRTFRAVHLSGQRISGDLLKVEQNKVWLVCPGIREPLPSGVEDLHSLLSHPLRGNGAETAVETTSEPAERTGRLEMEGTSLRGKLRDGIEGEAGCLVWQPVHSGASSPLERDAAARIVYRERKPVAPRPAATQPAMPVQPARPAGLFGLLFGGAAGPAKPRPAAAPTNAAQQAILHLRTGDTLPCTVTSISEEGVRFKTDFSDVTFARHDRIKALELQPQAAPVTIERLKKERLLVLPRMQRGNAPTQLIRSVGGDYLRGRLLAMDDTQITVEVRLEEKTLPRDRVARIIWLHPEEMEAAAKPAAADSDPVMRVQAIPSDGNRLTFRPERLEGQVLSGRSDLLGSCRVDLKSVDELLIGAAIERAAVALAFQQWRLTNAPDPLEAPEGGGESSDGLESALVGKPAPDIELDMLDGSRFRLAGRRNKIVVLDFWASWCGPCLQTMPQVDQVVREFANRDVELVGVNLEETPERVKPVLERLKLEFPVAFDRDGRVAERYGATSIPQTVIIDREGKVVRLFVGGGARFDETLRKALEAVLAGPAETLP